MYLATRDQKTIREALQRAVMHADSEQERREYTQLLERLTPLPAQIIDGLTYDYNDDSWMI